ncbi:recombinase RecA [uncultured Tyzzerella sp.]|uniref:recombinase RecA n=1 Tax=uncultured Tyzzerella sp. TaxID=2321398 RepID=UPI002943C309|nr:recombinase RecA [uncultured Tyzzerella sp.]
MADKKSKDSVMDNIAKGRETALKNALAQIEKQFGKGAVMKLGETNNKTVEVIPTGSLSLDVALGAGGVPKGRIIEIFGPESSGKTTVALHMVAEVQKAGGIAGFVDAEHALDPVYAQKIGVNIDELYISQPDDGEQALDITETMVRSGAIDIIIVDSVAALVPKSEIDGVMGDSHMGVQARLMSQALRKLTAITAKSKCIVIFINQLREKIGISYGSPETTTGGRALKFYASVRIDIRKGEPIKNGTDLIGARTKAKIAKNKIAPPFKTAEFDIIYGEGISHIGDVLDLGADLGIVTKGGAWYSYEETRLGQGRENAKKFLLENPHLLRTIENAVRKHYEMPELDEIKESIANTEAKPINDEEVEMAMEDTEFKADFNEEDALDFELLDENLEEDFQDNNLEEDF